MNLFNETIYKSYLAHSGKGQTWNKHKYLYITPSGRYVYESDLQSKQSRQESQIRSAHQGDVARSNSNQQATVGDRVNSALKKGRTSVQANSNVGNKISSLVKKGASAVNSASRNTITIKSNTPAKKSTTSNSTSASSKTEEKKTDTNKNTDLQTTNTEDKEKKTGSKKSGGKKGSGKKSGGSSKKAATTKESKQLGLTDDDVKNMEVNTDATDRDEVLKNLAIRVIRGDYGNGAERREKLGQYYNEIQKRVNELMKSGQINREGQSSQPTSQKTESKSSTTTSSKAYKKEDYKEGDKDFDDKNYSDKNRLGNTDFFSYKRDDGKYVILEEDMKWVVDEKPSSKMIKNLEAMDEYIDARQKNGTWEAKNAYEEWDRLASIAINGGDLTERAKAEKAKVKNKKSVKHYDLTEGSNYLMHWGKKRRSGRYPYGSGDRPHQHDGYVRKNTTFKERRSMSDDDLVNAINRVKKEAELYRIERDNRSVGQKFTEDVITSIGKDVLKTAGKGALLYAGKKFAEKVLTSKGYDEETAKGLGEAVFNGGPAKKKK